VAIEETMGQQGGSEEADGENGERDLEKEQPRSAGRAVQGDPGFVDEEMNE
jgi:hypothetical protein